MATHWEDEAVLWTVTGGLAEAQDRTQGPTAGEEPSVGFELGSS